MFLRGLTLSRFCMYVCGRRDGYHRGHLFRTYAKPIGKLTFLTAWYAYLRVLVTVKKFCVITIWMISLECLLILRYLKLDWTFAKYLANNYVLFFNNLHSHCKFTRTYNFHFPINKLWGNFFSSLYCFCRFCCYWCCCCF